MAYKINGTTVVDNSRNVCACCVTSCCITASDRMDAPSGTTANRPASPATGSVYFDTDLGALISYDGSNWIAPSGGVGMGLSSGLVNSDTEAWSAVHINFDKWMCRGRQGTCVYSNCCYSLCTGSLSGLYNAQGNRHDGSWQQVGCYAYQYAYNCFERSHLRKHGKYGANINNDCIPYSFLCGMCLQVEMGTATCGGIHGRFFQDGSFEYYSASSCYPFYPCGCANFQRSIIIDKYGNNHVHTAFFAAPNVVSSQPVYIPENSLAYQEYQTNGLNAPLGNFKQHIPFYTGSDHTYPLTICMCAAFEICSDYLHQNGYEVCDTLLINCSPYGSSFCKYPTLNTYPRATAFYPLETGFNFGSNSGCGYIKCICGTGVRYGGILGAGQYNPAYTACCCGDNFTYLSKCPQYNYRDPSFYTPKFTTPSGAKVGVSDEGFTNSIGYMRITHENENCLSSKDKGLYGGAGCTPCWNSFYWFSQNKCYLYHIYFRHCAYGSGWAKFSCSACQSVAGDTCFNVNFWPAVEVLDTTNGCVICSVYYCQYKDCQIPGSTYPYAICLTSCCLGFQCAAPFTCGGRAWSSKANGTFSWLEGHTNNIDGAITCMIRSCACPARIYMLPQPNNMCGNIRASVFNECTLNFECQFPVLLFSTTTVCCNLRALVGGSIGCCCTNACLACTYSCTYTSSSTPPCHPSGNIWDALTCTYMPLNHANGCFCLSVRGMDWYCYSEAKSGNFYYMNPTNDNLVMLLSIGKCCVSSCNQIVYWLGAVCYDVENCCISRVETLYPTHGDRCLASLTRGPECWGTCDPADQTQYYHLDMAAQYCICSTNEHCRSLHHARTYGTRNHTCGGLTIFTTGMLGLTNTCPLQINSTCCFCQGNDCFDINLRCGYFGKCALGGCVFGNSCCRTGQKEGLSALPSFAIGRIPWEQKLSCSGLFEEDAGMKCLFEMMLGCHTMGCSMYCNKQCCIDKIYCENFTPEFNCIVDITCQYSLGCTGVYTWGSTCWCSRRRWTVFDVANSCVCWCQVHPACCKVSLGTFASFMCCDIGGCTAAWNGYLAACSECRTQVSTAHCCLSETPCNDYKSIPTVLMCVGTDTVFNGNPNHRQLSNPSGFNFIQGYNKVETMFPGNKTNDNPPSSGGHYGWLSYQCLTCCQLKGKAGPLKWWFDNFYAEVL